MEKRIELEKCGKKTSNVKKLNLDQCPSTSIVGLTDEFCSLEYLSMVGVGLSSLKGLPKLLKLKELVLMNNNISGGLNILTNCPKLCSLNLSGNKIADIEALEPLKELTNLKSLDLADCGVASVDNYREKVFKLLPSLKFLDGFDKSNKEQEDSDEENNIGESDSEDEENNIDGTDSEENGEGIDGEEDDDDDDDEEDESDDDEEDGEVGLSYLEKEDIDEESDGKDYSPGGGDVDEEEDDEIDEEDEEENTPRGQKRKLENSED